jgi:hypothetical protein
VTRKWLGDKSAVVQNAAVCPLMLLYASIPATLALVYRKNTVALIIAFIACGLIYALVYARLVHFKWVIPKLRLATKC